MSITEVALQWLDAAVVATGLALAMALASPLLDRRPSLRHLLWVVVLVRFAVPTPLSIAWPLPSISVELPTLSSSPVNPPSAGDPFADGVAPEGAPVETIGAAAPGSSDVLASILIALWMSGAIVFLLRRLVVQRRWDRAVKRLRPVAGKLQAEVDRLAEQLKINAPRVVSFPDLPAPLVVHPVRPKLLWPSGGIAGISPQGNRAIIVHELAHIRRGDLWLSTFELFVSALWWWYPPMYWVRGRIASAAEEACDAWATRMFPTHRGAYAQALCECVPSSRSHTQSMGIAHGLGTVRRFKERVRKILKGRYVTEIGVLGFSVITLLTLGSLPLSLSAILAPSQAQAESVSTRSHTVAGIVSRGEVGIAEDGVPVASGEAWLVAFSQNLGESRHLLLTGAGELRYYVQGVPSPFDESGVTWLRGIVGNSHWSPGPADGSNSSSGALVPRGPHFHRTSEDRTFALWSGAPRPLFDDRGELSTLLHREHPLHVVQWSRATGAVRHIVLWSDERRRTRGIEITGAGERDLGPEATALARAVADRVS